MAIIPTNSSEDNHVLILDSTYSQFDQTLEKLMDIDNYVHDIISDSCQCDYPLENIRESEFSCRSSNLKEVLYRSVLVGRGADDCSNLLSSLGEAIRMEGASISVESNRLQISPSKCEIQVSSLISELICEPVSPTLGVSPQGQTAGATVGSILVVVVIVVIVIILVIVVVVVRNKRQKQKLRYVIILYHVPLSTPLCSKINYFINYSFIHSLSSKLILSYTLLAQN